MRGEGEMREGGRELLGEERRVRGGKDRGEGEGEMRDRGRVRE